MIRPPHAPWVAICLLLATAAYVRMDFSLVRNNHQFKRRDFTGEFGSWSCTSLSPESVSYYDHNVDKAWCGVCRQTDGSRAEVFAGYLEHVGKGTRILSPKFYYPGGDPGWNFVSSDSFEIPIQAADVPPLRANLTTIYHSRGIKEAILYWYQIGQRSYSDEYHYRASLVVQKLLHISSTSAVFRIASVVDDTNRDQVLSHEKDLAVRLYMSAANRAQ